MKIRKGANVVKLQQTPLNTRFDQEIRITNCLVSWSLKNIRESVNDEIIIDGSSTKIPQGHYTFTDLKNTLSTHGIKIEKLSDNRVTLESDKNLNLKNFGVLLGFVENKTITKNTKYTSTFYASLTNNLKEINIYCSLVDSGKNFSFHTNGYYRSSLLVSIPVDTTQSLGGTLTKYDMGNLRLPCRMFSGQDVNMDVVSGGHKYDYELYITMEIT